MKTYTVSKSKDSVLIVEKTKQHDGYFEGVVVYHSTEKYEVGHFDEAWDDTCFQNEIQLEFERDIPLDWYEPQKEEVKLQYFW